MMPTRRTFLALAGMLVVLLVSTPALAFGRDLSAAEAARAGTPKPPKAQPIGYDISYPQCGKPFPADPAFGIVWPLPVAAISDKDAAWPLVDRAKGIRI